MENKSITIEKVKNVIHNRRRWTLVLYDALLLFLVNLLILGVYPSGTAEITFDGFIVHTVLAFACVFTLRTIWNVYGQVWRYGGSTAYMRILISDAMAGVLYFVLHAVLPIQHIEFIRIFSISALNLLFGLGIRLLYQYLYEKAKRRTALSGLAWRIFSFMSGASIAPTVVSDANEKIGTKIKIAIVGAGNVGKLLAEELLKNPRASYLPCCFIDIDQYKIGREIMGIPVLSDADATPKLLAKMGVQEIVFALPQIETARRNELYEQYKQTGCKMKVYDFPLMQTTAANGKRHLREFDIEELLFRQPININNERTCSYYKDKVVLITGGGGSIGSELCRQIAKMQPKSLIILDIYENGAYDVQQELRIAYGDQLDLHIEIVSICDKIGLEKVFDTYRPDILLHAAAHKHVPLMEHNCCEAVKNNVFGTLNTVKLAIKYNVGRFIMVSTDKAVNPTNVMGATKRMCEMIVQSYSSLGGSTVFSATRFGNVLGSAGSVIPLFKRQIMNGGPVTVTDKRIIRYFMTIPEASQLVLESGAMAKNGELFVLDMGRPIKILELAENMIKLSGYEPYKDIDIVETGLRPGEKLYEELMIRTEELDKTENSMIFIERDHSIEMDCLKDKLAILRAAVEKEDNSFVKKALMEVVPTFHTPQEVNEIAEKSEEMQIASNKITTDAFRNTAIVV